MISRSPSWLNSSIYVEYIVVLSTFTFSWDILLLMPLFNVPVIVKVHLPCWIAFLLVLQGQGVGKKDTVFIEYILCAGLSIFLGICTFIC